MGPKKIINDVVLVDGDFVLDPEHWHCKRCHGQEFMFMTTEKVCKTCFEKGTVALPFICTYMTCASS